MAQRWFVALNQQDGAVSSVEVDEGTPSAEYVMTA